MSRRRSGVTWLALLGSFALVTWSVELAWWSGLDDSVNDWAASRRVSLLWNAAKVVFDVATPEIALPITLALGVLAAWRRRRWGIAGEAVVRAGLVVASVLLLKPLLAVPGPTRNSLGDHGGAFPSGHTTSTLVCVALLLVWVGWPRTVTGRVAVNALLVAVVGMAVMYLNFHFLSDVVGGILLGLLIATVPLPVFRHPRRLPGSGG
jgi:membrane-associated phospholipid phosphatase